MSRRTWSIIASILFIGCSDEETQAKAKAEAIAISRAAEMEREHQRKLAEEKARLAQEAALAAAETMRKAVEDEKARQAARAQAIEEARNQGVLGALAVQQGGAFASITGTGDVTSGFEDTDFQGGLIGNEAGEMQGGFGFGRSGFGPGGGGTGSGTSGLGNYGTLGHGSGTGEGYGVGNGRGGMRGRAAQAPTLRLVVTQVNGELDKRSVTRILVSKKSRAQYCYEKQLLVEPGLSGRVIARFEIDESGAVTSSVATGVNDEVASCVASTINSASFPRPRSGTVSVTAAFTMAPGTP